MIRAFICLLAIFSAPAAHSADLYIYSASSIATALETITKNYPKNRIHKIHIVSAATSVLAWQIMRGARADIFIAAHPVWLKKIKPRETVALAANGLVLVAHRHHPFTFTLGAGAKLEDAMSDKRLALSAPAIPAGFYTKQALSHYGLWAGAQKIAVFGGSARATLSWITRGDVAAGVIYSSDLHAHPDLRVVARFGRESHQPISYQMALLSSSQAAQELWAFLKSDKTRMRLKNHGFEDAR